MSTATLFLLEVSHDGLSEVESAALDCHCRKDILNSINRGLLEVD